jgi:rhamnosyltransferase
MQIISPGNSSEICAVITTYQPDEGFLEHVRCVQPQVGSVVIVDDGDSIDKVALLRNWFPETSSVILFHNLTNVGVAASLNEGISIAKRKGFRWALTLDDDTIVEPDLVENLIQMWRLAAEQNKRPIAIMGMAYADIHTGKHQSYPMHGHLFEEKRGIITSGSLMSLDAHDVIGAFRDEFFIDSVDYDYCLRARAKGFRVIRVCQVGMSHALGNSRKLEIGPFTLETTNHDPIRRYYAYRNSTVLVREHFKHDPLYALAVLIFQLKTLALVLLLEQDKSKKLRWIFRGWIDAWRNQLGKRTSNNEASEKLQTVTGPHLSSTKHGR